MTSYAELFNHAIASLLELEATWRELAENGSISLQTARKHIIEIHMTRERLFDDFFA